MIPFTNLHRHSQWSLLDGTGSGDQYAQRAVDLGQGKLALTDHGTLAGILEHISACDELGVQPICGVEAYFRDDRLDHNSVKHVDPITQKITAKQPKRFHLTLLAMNFQGWLNLQAMTSEAYATGFYYKPCVDWDLLNKYNEGVYCLLGCIGGMFSQKIRVGDPNDIHQYVMRMRGIFGERMSIEIMPHDFDDQRTLNIASVQMANHYGIPLAATGDTHYPFLEWADTQDIMLMLSTQQSNKKRAELDAKNKQLKEMGSGEEIKEYFSMKKENPTLHLMSGEEIIAAFALWHPDLHQQTVHSAVTHTEEITAQFEPFLIDRSIKMPKITRRMVNKIEARGLLEEAYWDAQPESPLLDTPDDDFVKYTLRKWVNDGLEEIRDLYHPGHWIKYPWQQYLDQIVHEFDTFDQIGDHVWRYMFMVAGEIRWARSDGVLVGAGRGSAAGSLVAYLAGITDLDPLAYDLMFERFINPNRKGMPDIDVDFMPGPRGRDKVKAHTGRMYGAENVIDIAAYARYGPKSCIKAVCRVFDDQIDFQMANHYSKVLDVLKPVDNLDLEACRARFPEINEFSTKYPELWKHALRIEGHPYTQSVHASGVLVKPSDVSIPKAIKITKGSGEREIVTAWPDTKELLANMGFLKIDYLVIEGLIRQEEILRALRERENSPIDLRKLQVRWDPESCDPEVMQNFWWPGKMLGVWQMEGPATVSLVKAIQPTNMHHIAAINALIRPGPRGGGMTDEYARRKNGESQITYWHESVEPALKNTLGLMIYQEQAMEISVQLGGFDRTEADDLRKAMGKKYREGMAVVEKFLKELGFYEKFVDNATSIIGGDMAVDIWKKILAFGGYSFNASHAYCYGVISYHDTLLKSLAGADFYAGYLSGASSIDLPKKLSGVLREGAEDDISLLPPSINKSNMDFTVIDKHTLRYGINSIKGVGPSGAKAIFENRPFTHYRDFAAKVPPKAVNSAARRALLGSGAFDDFGLRFFMSEDEKASNEEAYIGMRLSGKKSSVEYADLIAATMHTEEEFNAAQHGEELCIGGEVSDIKETVTKAKQEPMGFVTVAYGTESIRVTVFPKYWAAMHHLFVPGKFILFEGTKDVSEIYGAGFIGKACISLEELAAMRDR